MSTKRDPGSFDCYAKLADDEPYFVLRAKDPIAPDVVRFWVEQRRKLPGQADNPKFPEALECATAMEQWRGRHRGQA